MNVKSKYIFLFVVTLLIFSSCNISANGIKENSINVNSTQDVEITNDNVEAENEVSPEEDEEYENLDENTRELIEKANAGDLDAMNYLAYYYFNGIDVEQDYQKSLNWSIQSAEGGNVDSMFNVGYIYYYGYTGEVSYDLAFEWYERAAEHVHPKALNALGHMYYEGLGVEKNLDKALEYTRQSAGWLHNYSFSNMGTIIEEEELDGEANDWYRLAGKNYMIPSGSNSILYENLKSDASYIEVEETLKDADIPLDFVNNILYMFYAGTLYDYLESESSQFKDFDVSEILVCESHSYVTSKGWRYDNHYLVDVDDDGIAELISYQLEGTAGGSQFQVLENSSGVYDLKEENTSYHNYGINGLIDYEGKKYFLIAGVDIGNRAIYRVDILPLNGLQLDKMTTISLQELDTVHMQTYQVNDDFHELSLLVEKRIDEMFSKGNLWRVFYKNEGRSMVIDCDINNDGDIEHYKYEALFYGTINRPTALEFESTNSEEDVAIINKILKFNDLGVPIGLEIFTLEGINYVGVLSYALGTNNYCLTTFKLENDEFTVVLNHFITFDEKFILK